MVSGLCEYAVKVGFVVMWVSVLKCCLAVDSVVACSLFFPCCGCESFSREDARESSRVCGVDDHELDVEFVFRG